MLRVGEWSDQPITPFGDGLDVGGVLRVITQRLSEHRDGAAQHPFAHELLGPHRVDDGLSGQHLARVPGEEHQDVHGLRLELNAVGDAGEAVEAGLNQPVAEGERRLSLCPGIVCLGHSDTNVRHRGVGSNRGGAMAPEW
jgi:hypothetical protein